MIGWLNEKRARWVSLAVLAGFAILAAVAATRLGAWLDEAYSLVTTEGSPGLAASRAVEVEGQPPLYFVMLALWRRLDDSLAFARMLSVVITAAAAWTIARAVKAGDSSRPAWVEPVVLLYVLTNPFTFGYSVQARGYALQLLFGAIASLVVTRVATVTRASTREVVVLGIVGVLATYTHYYAALTIAVAAGVLFVTRLLSLKQFAAFVATLLLAAVPLLVYTGSHVQQVTSTHKLSPVESVEAVLMALLSNGVPNLTRHVPLQLAWVFALAVGLVIVWRRHRPADVSRFVAPKRLALVLCLTFAALCVLGSVVGPTALLIRYFAALYPLAWTGLVLLLGAILGWPRASVVLSAVIALAALRTYKIQAPAHRPGDWGPIAKSLALGHGSSRIVYAYPAEEALPGRFQLPAPFRVLGFPRDYDGRSVPVPADFVVEPPAVLAKRVAKTSGTGPFWLTISTEPFVPAGAQVDLAGVERFVDECCEVNEQRDFGEATLLLLTLRDTCLR